MGVGSCVFINKYYESKLDAEAVGIDKTFLDSSIFMQYCQEKSLNNYLNKLSSIMSMKIKIFLLSQVTIGLRYLRDFGIVHLDMKPQNLLVKMAATTTTNAFALIKIIDFGQAYGQYLINKSISFLTQKLIEAILVLTLHPSSSEIPKASTHRSQMFSVLAS